MTTAALLVGVILLVASGCGSSDSDPTSASEESRAALVASDSALLEAVAGAGYPVYWAGPRSGVEYEVSRSPGRTYVRYLPEGEKTESEQPFLTVGSYQQSNALASVREQGQKPDAILVRISGGGTAFAEGPAATNAYLAFPGTETQVEVFDPEPGKALSLIREETVVPVGGAG